MGLQVVTGYAEDYSQTTLEFRGFTPFHTKLWLSGVKEIMGWAPLALTVLEGDEVVGGFSASIRNMHCFSLITSAPFTPYGGMFYSQRLSSESVLNMSLIVAEELKKRGLNIGLTFAPGVVEVRGFRSMGAVAVIRYTALSSLNTDFLRRGQQKQRYHLKRARAAGYTIADLVAGDLAYDLISDTLRRANVRPPCTRPQFNGLYNVARSLGMLSRVAFSGSQIVGIRAVIQMGKWAYDWIAGASQVGDANGVNSLLVDHILNELVSRGVEHFDWCGANMINVSLFKHRWGGVLSPTVAIYSRLVGLLLSILGRL